MSHWGYSESTENDVESELSKRLNNAISRAHQSSSSDYYNIRTNSQINDTNSTVDDARRLLATWTSSINFQEQENNLYDDLNLAALETITTVDPERVHSGGDFVTQYLNENESNFSLAENAIENTQEFLDRLMRVEIPKNSPKSEKPKNFSQNQKARMSVINDRKNQRQKEMKIRLAAEKAARELEKQKFEENKKRENKKREIEEKLVNAEIHKLRTQLQNESTNKTKVSNVMAIQEKNRALSEKRKLEENRRKQVENRIRLEARNKIIIQDKIQKHLKKNIYIKKRYFYIWQSVLVERRKQLGVATACYHWRITKNVFASWRRLNRKQKDFRMIEQEKQKAKKFQIFRNRTLRQKDEILTLKIFHAWRILTRNEIEKQKLVSREEETKRKMEELIKNLKKSKIVEDIEDVEPIEVVETVKVTSFIHNNKTKSIQAWQVNSQNAVKRADSILQYEPVQKPKLVDPFQNRHRHQMLLINEQTKRIQIQNETIKALAEQKAISAKKEIKDLETCELPNPNRLIKKPKNSTKINITSIVKPHQSVLNMEKRTQEREFRKLEIEKLKKLKQTEKEKQLEQERNKRIEAEKEEKRQKLSKIRLEREAKLEKENLKKNELHKNSENLKIARDHRISVITRKCYSAFKSNSVKTKEWEQQKVHEMNVTRLRPLFSGWVLYVKRVNNIKRRNADSFRYKYLIKSSFARWKIILKIEEHHRIVADNHFARIQKHRILKQWSQSVIDEKIEEWRKTTEAHKHRKLLLIKIAFQKWKSLKVYNKMEAERESRRIRLRALVKEVIPDY